MLECTGEGGADTRHQRCPVHKTANVLASLTKSVQPKGKSERREVWLPRDRDPANKALDGQLVKYGAKSPAAMKTFTKECGALLAFATVGADKLEST